MANQEKNQFWLPKDKISFKTIKDQINFIETYYLTVNQSIDQSINLIFNNSNNTSDEHNTSIFKEINNVKSDLNSTMIKLKTLEITINKNLKSQKINAFKNFIIKFFTFGKINRNKSIKNEISTFKSDCQKLKDKSEDIVKTLNDKTKEILLKIEEKHKLLKQENTKLRNKYKIYEQEIEQLKSNSQEDKKTIDELKEKINKSKQENQQLHKFINTDNNKFIGTYIILNNIIKGLKQEIEILKQNQESKTKNELTDSGNESTPETLEANITNFDKDKINNVEQKSVIRKKRNKGRIVKIDELKVTNTEEERKKFINSNI